MSKSKKQKIPLSKSYAQNGKLANCHQEITAFEIQQGPLPPPQIFAGYEEVLPGSADRLIKMVESQNEHRQEIERRLVASSIKTVARGQYLGFTIAITTIVGGIVLIALGKSVSGLTTILTALGGLIGVFLYNISIQRKKIKIEQSEGLKKGIQP